MRRGNNPGYKKTTVLNITWLILAILFIIIIFSPIIWMVLCSLRNNIEVFTFPPRIIPKKITLVAYLGIFSDESFLRSIFNTFFVCFVTTLLSLALSTLAAYGFTRYKFFGKKILQQYILTTQMIPIILLALPYFLILTSLNLYDSLLGLIIAYTSFTLPFCSLTMIGFFNSIPRELDEAALMDGCSHFTAFLRVVLPLSIPGLIATGMFAFVYAWNEYLMALVLTSSEETRMLTIFIGSKIGQYNTVWNELMATAVVASIPLIVVYTFLQRYFQKGITAGALKI